MARIGGAAGSRDRGRRSAVLAIGLLAVLGACAQPARLDQMVPEASARPAGGSWLDGALCVTAVSGGRDTDETDRAEVSDIALEKALVDTLVRNRLSPRLKRDCRYGLEAALVAVPAKAGPPGSEVSALIDYRVLARGGDAPVYASTVEAPFVVQTGRGAVGVDRLQRAKEGAVRANIGAFIDDLIAATAR